MISNNNKYYNIYRRSSFVCNCFKFLSGAFGCSRHAKQDVV